MSKWEHCAVYVALYRDGTGGGTRELLSVQMPGEPQKGVTNPLGVIGLLNELGSDGWNWSTGGRRIESCRARHFPLVYSGHMRSPTWVTPTFCPANA
jgi:hypothetical protein